MIRDVQRSLKKWRWDGSNAEPWVDDALITIGIPGTADFLVDHVVHDVEIQLPCITPNIFDSNVYKAVIEAARIEVRLRGIPESYRVGWTHMTMNLRWGPLSMIRYGSAIVLIQFTPIGLTQTPVPPEALTVASSLERFHDRLMEKSKIYSR